MKPRALFAAVLLAFIHRAPAADEPAHFYARDERTEIVLTPAADGGASFEFRAYGSAAEGRVLYHGGDLAKTAEGALRYEQDLEGKKSVVTIAGRLGDETLRVETSGIEKLDGAAADVNGAYRRLPIAAVLERARQRHAAADAELNAAYKSLRAELKAKAQAELRDSQRAWIEERDHRADFAARGADDAKTQPDYWEELLSQTTTRIRFLKVYTGKGVPPGLSGKYEDFSGGSLDIALFDAGLEFSIEVVRGPSLALGEISGFARRKNDRVFAYREKIPDDEKSPDRQPAELTFTVAGHRIRIEGKNTEAHHGARAYFDGVYLKTAAPK